MKQKEQILKLLKSKKSTNQIKEILNVSGSAMTNISKGYGISLVERNRLIREGKSPKVLFLNESKITKKVIKQLKRGRSKADTAKKYDITM